MRYESQNSESVIACMSGFMSISMYRFDQRGSAGQSITACQKIRMRRDPSGLRWTLIYRKWRRRRRLALAGSKQATLGRLGGIEKEAAFDSGSDATA